MAAVEPVSLELLRRQLQEKKRAIDQGLSHSGGGSTYDGMSEVDAKIAAAEARTDTKFAEMMGELRLIKSETSGVKSTILVTTIGTGIAVVGLVAAIFGWGSAMFGVGMDADTIARQAAESVETRITPQIESLSANYEQMNQRFSEVLQAIQDRPAEQQPEFAPLPMPQGGEAEPGGGASPTPTLPAPSEGSGGNSSPAPQFRTAD